MQHMEQFNDEHGDPGPVHKIDEGTCQRMPPTVIHAPGTFTLALMIPTDQRTVWPVTTPRHWCGEWMAANPTTVDDAATVMARNVLAGDAGAARALADKLIELVSLPVIDPAPEEPPQ
jgi:hypothetical protein